VKALVVACNSVEVATAAEIAEEKSLPIVGVIEPAVRAAVAVALGKDAPVIGVIGTEATIASQAYDWALARTGTGLELVSVPCPEFVDHIEGGDTSSPALRAVVEESLEGLSDEPLGALILGCTHYPLIAPMISEVVGQDVTLISSADGTAEELARALDQKGARAPEGATAELTVLCTGDPQRFQDTADRFLGREVAHVTSIELVEV
jgi:glutamate racemase